jgi:D-threo-aldose 1-dehydrogenase
MDPFAPRRLGRTDVRVTPLGFGSGTLGDRLEVIPEAQAEATVAAAWEAGVRYFDTAPFYGLGKSEHRVGRILRNQPRDEFVLSTKVGRVLFPAQQAAAPREGALAIRWAGGLPFDLRFDYTGVGIMRSFEDSLQRLGMARVDALLIHDLDLMFHVTEEQWQAEFEQLDGGGGFAALAGLKQAGAIGAIGAGINQLGMIPRFLERFDLDFFLVAVPYTLLDQAVLDEEFPLCAARGAGVVIGAPFASGILATGPRPGASYAYVDAGAEVLERTRRIEAVCQRHGVPLGAAALQFPLGHPSVAAVIPGPNSPEQARQNVAWMRWEIPPALWAELKAAGLLRADAPTP